MGSVETITVFAAGQLSGGGENLRGQPMSTAPLQGAGDRPRFGKESARRANAAHEEKTRRRALVRSAAGIVLGVLVLAGTAVGDAAKSRFEPLMGPKFREAALDRATPAGIALLEQFMIEHAGELRALMPAPDATSAVAVVAAESARERRAGTKSAASAEPVSSRIAGAGAPA
ncbi:hypothetical protein [Tahibacter aquaticus]|nr:hypothetical protein [Tahibacter aquaticus]